MKRILISLTIILTLVMSSATYARWIKGIYITQSTLLNRSQLSYLINRSKASGINSFVIDIKSPPSSRYFNNIQLVKQSGLRYVARIVVFPDGGSHWQITSQSYWQQKYHLVQYALNMGANAIQLDYIRYRSSQPASSENAKNIYQVIHWFKNKLAPTGVPLEIDVFGETSFGASRHIGQNLKLFANTVDAMCPMLYPSHFEPYERYAKLPYYTVYSALQALKQQFNNRPPFKIYAFIELSNYRYRHSPAEKIAYLYDQIKATQDAGANGWYAWSAKNQYNNLFYVLQRYRTW